MFVNFNDLLFVHNVKVPFPILAKIFPLIESGAVKPTVCAEFPITQAEDAQKMMADGRQVGKIVLTV